MKIIYLLFVLTLLVPDVCSASGGPGDDPLSFAVQLKYGSMNGESPANIDNAILPLSGRNDDLKKSPFLAGILSLIVPGAGDIYAENYIMAAVFATAEVALWVTHFNYMAKGDNQTALFESFADQHWNVVKYTDWLNKWGREFPGGEDTEIIYVNPDESLPPWERVDWDAMNRVEDAIIEFSHRLPRRPDQQYYEQIGKYPQYNHGWDDQLTDTKEYFSNLSPRFLEYAGMRGDANDLYAVGETAVKLVILNHILAAANAAWSVSRYNKSVKFFSRVDLRRGLDGRLVPHPTASIRVRF
ncbi:MAG: hypothetical protein GXO82_10020 [Chlorobi bacterium]|nr:hypothetical protein [Chlorobiota bacterium]